MRIEKEANGARKPNCSSAWNGSHRLKALQKKLSILSGGTAWPQNSNPVVPHRSARNLRMLFTILMGAKN